MTLNSDMHMVACQWLEESLDLKLFQFDVDDVKAMIEQVVQNGIKGDFYG